MTVATLSKEDVIQIHQKLVEDFAGSVDPIDPPGIRSDALLESAVGRQHVALGDVAKYPTISESAATLLFGLCMDHPFLNGNKRTALVSMLAHLDKNKHCLFEINQRELFNMIIQVATHQFQLRDDPTDEVGMSQHGPLIQR